jgi:hypothetical protein
VPAASLTCAVDVWAAGIFLASTATGIFLCNSIATMVRMLGPLTDQVWPNVSTMAAYHDLDIARLSASCDDWSGSQPGLLRFFGTASGPRPGVPPSGGRLIPPAVLNVLQEALTWLPANRASTKCADMCRSGSRQRAIHEAIRRPPHRILARVAGAAVDLWHGLLAGRVGADDLESVVEGGRVPALQPAAAEAGQTSGGDRG